MFMDDLHTEGFQSLTKTFLERSKIDEDVEEEEKEKLVKAMCSAKDITREKIFNNFYTTEICKNYSNEKYLNGQGVETIFPSEFKAHFYMLGDGNFKVYDPFLK